MIIAIFVLITIKPIMEYSEGGLEMLPVALIFPEIGFTVLFTNELLENNNFIIYTTDDGQVEIEVRLEDENFLTMTHKEILQGAGTVSHEKERNS